MVMLQSSIRTRLVASRGGASATGASSRPRPFGHAARSAVKEDPGDSMTMSDKDTDPSTPQAMRPPEGVAEAASPASASGSARLRECTTDPGLGPGSGRVSSAPPRGIVVPPPTPRSPPGAGSPSADADAWAPSLPKKDSVELLLDGMTGPRPDRTKTMPQSDGEAAAAYHAQHGLHAAGTARDGGPKVLVERWPLPVRPALDGAAASTATEPTARRPVRDLQPRVGAAAV